MNLDTAIQSILNKVVDAGAEGDLIIDQGQSLSLKAQNGALEEHKVTSNRILGLRVIRDAKVGTAYSEAIDDEGMDTQRTQLIKDGKLTSFLVDRVGSEQTGFARTGSGRRESYKYAPASRMRNTFIEPGEHAFDDMIESIDHGIFAAQMGGGSVQPGTGEFNFAVTEGYLIESGKIKHPVKAATLISTGPAVLQEISMVGNDFSLACGMCGSVSGAIPTTVGQATLKVDDILVGGQE